MEPSLFQKVCQARTLVSDPALFHPVSSYHRARRSSRQRYASLFFNDQVLQHKPRSAQEHADNLHHANPVPRRSFILNHTQFNGADGEIGDLTLGDDGLPKVVGFNSSAAIRA